MPSHVMDGAEVCKNIQANKDGSGQAEAVDFNEI